MDRPLDALRSATTTQLVAVRDAGGLPMPSGVRIVTDIRPERASLVGLHTALTFAEGAALVLAWDMPFVSGSLLRALRALGEHNAVAVVPEGPHGPEALCAYYPRSTLSVVERQLERAELRLSAFVDALGDVTILRLHEMKRFGAPEHLFDNVNSPADLTRVERELHAAEAAPADGVSSLREHP